MHCLLASDLDETLIPVEAAESAAFSACLGVATNVRLAYVTGRHLELALDGIQRWGLPTPEFLICDVGTTLYRPSGAGWCLDSGFRQVLSALWNGHDAEAIASVLRDVPGLEAQEAARQSEFKRSYYVRDPRQARTTLDAVTQRLADRALASSLIYSEESDGGIGLLDVLPRGASKHAALTHLVLACDLTADDVVYAGDSGNDIAVFLSGIRSIVVGNASAAVKAHVRSEARSRKLEARVYFAQGARMAGVLEGCGHFGVFEV